MKKDITELFCWVDDFIIGLNKEWQKKQLADGYKRSPTRVPCLAESELVTIILLFQQSPCRHFKFFYHSYLQLYRQDFTLPTYERFIALMPRVLSLLVLLLLCLLKPSKGIAFVDSTALAVCHNKRITRHRVFAGLAALGKTTKGWFFGFKLHVIIDNKGNLVRVKLTPGNTDDRSAVSRMVQGMQGFLFGDKGYISKALFLNLYKKGLKLVTGIRKTMKNQVMLMHEKLLLRKRSLIETVFDYLKNKFALEHTRHRSPCNMLIHVVSTLIAYQLKSTKPSLTGVDVLPSV